MEELIISLEHSAMDYLMLQIIDVCSEEVISSVMTGSFPLQYSATWKINIVQEFLFY